MTEAVSLYCVNGLRDDPTDWLGPLLDQFAAENGVKVQCREGHSRATVQSLIDEREAPKADVVITLPPFVHMAEAEGLLTPTAPAPLRDQSGAFHLLVRDFPCLIAHADDPALVPNGYEDLLDDRFKGRIQYSKPGWSGAGTALLLQCFKAFGGKQGGIEFLRKLQRNCQPPCAHTQGLEEEINSGRLLVANGDLQTNLPQMSDFPNLHPFLPAAPDGKRYIFEFSYYIGLVAGGPNPQAGKKLIDFLLGDQAQRSVSTIAQGLPGRKDVVADDPLFRRMTEMVNGAELWEPDWLDIIANLDADVAWYSNAVLNDA
ncbi:MAG: extracellular solute-binding protein [Sphingomonadales bacterium]|nr:extracellular solute-binding protein [Sphingomonadales bacterium]